MGSNKESHQGQCDAYSPEESNGISYGGFLQITNRILNPEIFHSLTGNEFKLLYYLSFLRWKFPKANGLFRLAYSYLERGTGLSEGSLKRLMKSLAEKGFLLCVKVNKDWRTSKGNDYLTYPCLLWDKSLPQTDQIDLSLTPMTDQIDLRDRSKRSVIDPDLGTMTDQIDLQDHINTSLIGDAARYPPINQPEGRIERPERRSPNGQDQGKGKKGVLTDTIKKDLKSIQKTGFPSGAPRERHVGK